MIEYKKVVIIETVKMVTTVSNGYQKMIKTICNSHKGQIVSTITSSPFSLRVVFYLNITTTLVASVSFFVSLCC